MEAINDITLDLLMEILESDMENSSLPPNDTPAEECCPQEPMPECHMTPGAELLSLDPPVLPAPAEECCPQKPMSECHMTMGAEFLSLDPQVLPAPGIHDVQTDLPLLPLYDEPGEEGFNPQQPQTEGHMPLGAAQLSLQQQIMPAPGFHDVQAGYPLLPPYFAPAQERFGPQQPQTEGHMPLGTFSLQQQVMPSSGLAPPMYQPPNVFPPNYYCQGAPFSHVQVNNVPVVSLPQGLDTNLTQTGFVNGEMVCRFPTNTAFPVVDVPEVYHKATENTKSDSTPHNESKPYVKKPPNAFMIFRMEQRPYVVEELQNKECAAVNKVIGQRWKSLSDEEQAKYYKRAEIERQIHSQCFPEWSTRENYGKKRKRIRRKGPVMTEDSGFGLYRE